MNIVIALWLGFIFGILIIAAVSRAAPGGIPPAPKSLIWTGSINILLFSVLLWSRL